MFFNKPFRDNLRIINTLFLFSLLLFSFACKEKTKPKPKQRVDVNVDPFKYPGMVYIPAGDFVMGTDIAKEAEYPNTYGFLEEPYEDEQPIRKVYLEGFYIDKYEVTIGEYSKFTKATNRKPPIEWVRMKLDIHRFSKYPVTHVTWADALAYAQWVDKKLPSEAEWEKAARGTDGRRYPWGNKFDEKMGNFSKKGTMRVGFNKNDVSPFGVFDMGGSVSEWTRDALRPYEGNPAPYRSIYKESLTVYRGGSWGGLGGHYYLFPYFARSAFRGTESEDMRSPLLGFRCVREIIKN